MRIAECGCKRGPAPLRLFEILSKASEARATRSRHVFEPIAPVVPCYVEVRDRQDCAMEGNDLALSLLTGLERSGLVTSQLAGLAGKHEHNVSCGYSKIVRCAVAFLSVLYCHSMSHCCTRQVSCSFPLFDFGPQCTTDLEVDLSFQTKMAPQHK